MNPFTIEALSATGNVHEKSIRPALFYSHSQTCSSQPHD